MSSIITLGKLRGSQIGVMSTTPEPPTPPSCDVGGLGPSYIFWDEFDNSDNWTTDNGSPSFSGGKVSLSSSTDDRLKSAFTVTNVSNITEITLLFSNLAGAVSSSGWLLSLAMSQSGSGWPFNLMAAQYGNISGASEVPDLDEGKGYYGRKCCGWTWVGWTNDDVSEGALRLYRNVGACHTYGCTGAGWQYTNWANNCGSGAVDIYIDLSGTPVVTCDIDDFVIWQGSKS